ncbi:glycoside hydrolase family 172 protein [Candidatus Latescibacterota bacterium]
MQSFNRLMLIAGLVIGLAGCSEQSSSGYRKGISSDIFRKGSNIQTRWASFENPTAEKGMGGMTNRGAKGNACENFEPGETKVLLDAKGSGVVNRMWFTMYKPEGPGTVRIDPVILRSIRIEMYWDNAPTPAVSAPLGDFFCCIMGETMLFENELFSNPGGKSLVFHIPMPFRTAAKIQLINGSDEKISQIFYDINFCMTEQHDDDVLYFHAYWRRERWTKLGEDFEILPRIRGVGRYIGAHIGVITHPDNIGWWGEGEAKIYLDGDTDRPSLNGTGAEDYCGNAFGLDVAQHRYQGVMMSDYKRSMHSFYRYHIPDPVYFYSDCRVTIQQLGAANTGQIRELMKKGVPVKPATVSYGSGWETRIRLLEDDSPEYFDDSIPEDSATVHYRIDDYCATAFFYLDSPENGLPPLAGLEERVIGIGSNVKKE